MSELQHLNQDLQNRLDKLFGPGTSLFIARDAAVDVDNMIKACQDAVFHLQRYKMLKAKIVNED